MIYETKIRVRYAEIDAQGHVNNATYLSYFEVGRVEWLRATGQSYREMEDRGRGLVVVEALLHYRRPAFFDDELTLRTDLTDLGKVSLRFEYEVLRDGEVLTTGHTRHACVDLSTGKPVRMPQELLRLAPDTP
ncbi:MAG TPA: thioesterase family protein [Rubrobacter sp.]|nr:thioesterase family protein [Rubrobacter sp.]